MSDAFPDIFQRLRALMLQAAPAMVITDDGPTNFTLKTPWIEARTKEPAWFGWIAIKKSYVAYHVMPLYSLPALNDAVPAALEKRRQGKTCFNFKKVDEALFEELRKLTEEAARRDPDLRAAIGA
jgi:hypothetical protein